MHIPSPRAAALLGVLTLVAACGDGGGSVAATPAPLFVTVQNSVLLPGVDRLGIALLTTGNRPVLDATVRIDVADAQNRHVESEALQFIGDQYGQIPVYLGAAAFPTAGTFHLVVHATLRGGGSSSATADVAVLDHSPTLPVGHRVAEVKDLKQRVARDVGGNLAVLDSGIVDGRSAPDPFHDATIQDGLDQHRPMLLFFGEPGHCVSETCGPTVALLEQMYPRYRDRMLFEHIEVMDPAGSAVFNPVVVAFGFTTEPWVYLVNAQGVVADRFEGPVTLEQLEAAADGTLAGKVPAVDVPVNG